MAKLDSLRRIGLAVELEDGRLRVTPADRITPTARQFVRLHRDELLAELLAERAAANDSQAGQVHMEPQEEPSHDPAAPAPAFTGPITAATATPAWVAARDACYGHLMTCHACHAPTGRYCPAGADLRHAYDSIPWS